MSAAIKIEKENDSLFLIYHPRDGAEWVRKKLEEDGNISIQGTFYLESDDVSVVSDDRPNQDDEFSISFKIASLENDYYAFDKRILDIKFELFIHSSIDLNNRSFTAVKNISVFRAIGNQITNDVLRIGGSSEASSLTEEEFNHLIAVFPNTYELKKYANARVSSILKDKFELSDDAEIKYHSYLNKKMSDVVKTTTYGLFRNQEIAKYQTLLDRLRWMLDNETDYSEHQWQDEILEFILLLFPKYLYAFKNAPVVDTYYGKERGLDFLLVDYSGNIDIVEIKRPFEKGIVTQSGYRDNYIPLRELSGTIMQVEKYIFYLMKSGLSGEKKLNKKYRSILPDSLSIRITNPKGLIITGRSNNLSSDQLNDFEIIKRKYNNIVDILSYDDLLKRLELLINQFEAHSTPIFE